jgi:hypothetical protein
VNSTIAVDRGDDGGLTVTVHVDAADLAAASYHPMQREWLKLVESGRVGRPSLRLRPLLNLLEALEEGAAAPAA